MERMECRARLEARRVSGRRGKSRPRSHATVSQYRGDGKWLVRGRGQGGRWIQVVFVLDDENRAFVIHARPLTVREKRRSSHKEER